MSAPVATAPAVVEIESLCAQNAAGDDDRPFEIGTSPGRELIGRNPIHAKLYLGRFAEYPREAISELEPTSVES